MSEKQGKNRTMTGKEKEATLSVEELGQTFRGISAKMNQRKTELEEEARVKAKKERKKNKKNEKTKPTERQLNEGKKPTERDDKVKSNSTTKTTTEVINPYAQSKSKKKSESTKLKKNEDSNADKRKRATSKLSKEKTKYDEEKRKNEEELRKKLVNEVNTNKKTTKTYKTAFEQYEELSDDPDQQIQLINCIQLPKFNRTTIGRKVHGIANKIGAKFPKENSSKPDIVKVQVNFSKRGLFGNPDMVLTMNDTHDYCKQIDPTLRLAKIKDDTYEKGTVIEPEQLERENYSDYIYTLSEDRHKIKVIFYVITTLPLFTKYLFHWFADNKNHTIKTSKFLHLRTVDVVFFMYACKTTINIVSLTQYIKAKTLKRIKFNIYERRVFLTLASGSVISVRSLVLETIDKDGPKALQLLLVNSGFYMTYNYVNITPVPIRMEPNSEASRCFMKHKRFMDKKETILIVIKDNANYATFLQQAMAYNGIDKQGRATRKICKSCDIHPQYLTLTGHKVDSDELYELAETIVTHNKYNAEIVHCTQSLLRSVHYSGLQKLQLLIDSETNVTQTTLVKKHVPTNKVTGTNVEHTTLTEDEKEEDEDDKSYIKEIEKELDEPQKQEKIKQIEDEKSYIDDSEEEEEDSCEYQEKETLSPMSSRNYPSPVKKEMVDISSEYIPSDASEIEVPKAIKYFSSDESDNETHQSKTSEELIEKIKLKNVQRKERYEQNQNQIVRAKQWNKIVKKRKKGGEQPEETVEILDDDQEDETDDEKLSESTDTQLLEEMEKEIMKVKKKKEQPEDTQKECENEGYLNEDYLNEEDFHDDELTNTTPSQASFDISESTGTESDDNTENLCEETSVQKIIYSRCDMDKEVWENLTVPKQNEMIKRFRLKLLARRKRRIERNKRRKANGIAKKEKRQDIPKTVEVYKTEQNSKTQSFTKEEIMNETKEMVGNMMEKNNEKIFQHVDKKHSQIRDEVRAMKGNINLRLDELRPLQERIKSMEEERLRKEKVQKKQLDSIQVAIKESTETTKRIQKDATLAMTEHRERSERRMSRFETQMKKRHIDFEMAQNDQFVAMEERAKTDRDEKDSNLREFMLQQFRELKNDKQMTKTAKTVTQEDDTKTYEPSQISDSESLKSLERRYENVQNTPRKQYQEFTHVAEDNTDDDGPMNEINIPSIEQEWNNQTPDNSDVSTLGTTIPGPAFPDKEEQQSRKRKKLKESTRKVKKQKRNDKSEERKKKGSLIISNSLEQPASDLVESSEGNHEDILATPITKNSKKQQISKSDGKTQLKLAFTPVKEKKKQSAESEPKKVMPNRSARKKSKYSK